MLRKFLKFLVPIYLSFANFRASNDSSSSQFFDFSKLFLILSSGFALTFMVLVFFLRLLDNLHIYFSLFAEGLAYESAVHAGLLLVSCLGLYGLYIWGWPKPTVLKAEQNLGVSFFQGLITGYNQKRS